MTPALLANWRLLIAAVALIGVVFGGFECHHLGVKQEGARRDAIAAKKAIATAKELAALNEKIRVAQADLATARIALEKLEEVNRNEQIASTKRESALRAGTERLRADFVKRGAGQAGSPAGGPASDLDHNASIAEDLAPEVAGNLESLRRNENNAIDRLGACIKAYDAVKSASEK